ncbi:Sporulation and spore germination [Haloechinothrix alba]|uniref:Sporulation and spore germination n=1 Tax=Haloechinothrix alba TaxID=664784 RepID=A0A238VCC4_9PSEU|nr:LpqB family beta-propeller domain-containing protein [Haloechinothrix alba]SNR31906.1 Sporulation and spore germination [Haloechinothrix alba]
MSAVSVERLPARARTARWVAVLVAVALLGGACANVPQETQPQAIGEDDTRTGEQDELEGPEDDLSSTEIVRGFVEANARSADHEAARLYLEDDSRETWRPSSSMVILDSSPDTVPADFEEQPSKENETAVLLRGTQIGSLRGDGSFDPMRREYERVIRLRKQPNGQWRIVDPPSEVMTTEDEFTANYLRVPLYFFAPDSDVRVPDPRYLPRRPQAGQPSKVIDLLLEGPSGSLRYAVDNPLGEDVTTETNVTGSPDGALVVPLTGVEGVSDETRERIAEQVVMSLDNVTSSRVRLRADGAPLIQGNEDLRRADMPDASPLIVPSADLPGMSVVSGALHSLGTGGPVEGPAGEGEYDLVSAGQSLDGEQLAAVERRDDGVHLRVGPVSGDLQRVELEGTVLTRPTWWPTLTEDAVSNEVWTVQDGEKVVRVVQTQQGTWTPLTVDSSELVPFGEISGLRLSRDGTRAAVVTEDGLVIAGVEREENSVALRNPRVIREGRLVEVTDVDWMAQDTLAVATASESRPVTQVSADGFRIDSFRDTNLSPPVHAITAAPGRSVVVSDVLGQWVTSDVGDVWQQHPNSEGAGSLAKPFYPG